MLERASLIGAVLEITSHPGKGTHISLIWRGNPG
jgi:signal transduction histidine kinase